MENLCSFSTKKGKDFPLFFVSVVWVKNFSKKNNYFDKNSFKAANAFPL